MSVKNGCDDGASVVAPLLESSSNTEMASDQVVYGDGKGNLMPFLKDYVPVVLQLLLVIIAFCLKESEEEKKEKSFRYEGGADRAVRLGLYDYQGNIRDGYYDENDQTVL